ncbi:hypothetical protein AAMO2058_001476200 [Amorphochlora amoebiformis]
MSGKGSTSPEVSGNLGDCPGFPDCPRDPRPFKFFLNMVSPRALHVWNLLVLLWVFVFQNGVQGAVDDALMEYNGRSINDYMLDEGVMIDTDGIMNDGEEEFAPIAPERGDPLDLVPTENSQKNRFREALYREKTGFEDPKGEYHNIPESYDALRLPVDTSDTAKQLLGSSKPAAPQNPRFREERAEANTAQNTSMNSTGEATRAASSANASDTQSLAEESVLKGLVSTNFSILEGLTLESLSNATAASGSGTGLLKSVLSMLASTRKKEQEGSEKVEEEERRAKQQQEALRHEKAKLEETHRVSRRLEMCLIAAQAGLMHDTTFGTDGIVQREVKVQKMLKEINSREEKVSKKESSFAIRSADLARTESRLQARENALDRMTREYTNKIQNLETEIQTLKGSLERVTTKAKSLATGREALRQCQRSLPDLTPIAGGSHFRFRSSRSPEDISLHAEAHKNECKSKTLRERCDEHKGCGSCTADTQCGWCAGAQACIPGNAHAPTEGANILGGCQASSWFYLSCPGYSCANYRDCKTCVADVKCAVCRHNSTFRCVNSNFDQMDHILHRDVCPSKSLIRANPGSFRLATLNVFGRDAFQQNQRGMRIIHHLKQANADFVTLQDVHKWFLDSLRKDPWLRNTYYASDFGGNQAPAGLVMLSKYPLRKTAYYEETLPGQFSPDDRAKLLLCKPDIPGSKDPTQELVIATTSIPLNTTAARRAAALDFVFSLLSVHKNAVLMGGFNFDADSQPESSHIPSKYADVWTTLHSHERGATWDPVSNVYAFRTDRKSLPARTERVFVGSTHWKPRSVEMFGRCDAGTGFCPSNRYGLVAEMSLYQSFC